MEESDKVKQQPPIEGTSEQDQMGHLIRMHTEHVSLKARSSFQAQVPVERSGEHVSWVC